MNRASCNKEEERVEWWNIWIKFIIFPNISNHQALIGAESVILASGSRSYYVKLYAFILYTTLSRVPTFVKEGTSDSTCSTINTKKTLQQFDEIIVIGLKRKRSEYFHLWDANFLKTFLSFLTSTCNLWIGRHFTSYCPRKTEIQLNLKFSKIFVLE